MYEKYIEIFFYRNNIKRVNRPPLLIKPNAGLIYIKYKNDYCRGNSYAILNGGYKMVNLDSLFNM